MKNFHEIILLNLISAGYLAGAVAATSVSSATVAPVPTVTGTNLNLPTNAFGGAIEGVGVNKKGDVFAVDFEGGGQPPSSAFGFFFQTCSGTNNVLSDANPVFTVPSTGSEKPPLINSIRFMKDNTTVLLADAANSRVLKVTKNGTSYKLDTFCSDQRILQPNDIAVSTRRDSLIFLSGQNYTAHTIAGVSGDLWTCDDGRATQFDPSILAAADIHRTNGIETSPDGKFLYLSSARNVGGQVVSNKIFRFALDQNTGYLLKQAPTLFYDFVDSPSTDIDGMRTDVVGNLFVTRNGDGKIVKISPEGKLLAEIVLPGMGGPSSLEFGGSYGSTLFAVGKCADNATVGCAVSFETDSVGKAFSILQKS